MTEGQRKSSLFRAVNDRIREINKGWDAPGPAGFVCECDDPSCSEILSLTVAEYEAVRARDDSFVVLRGHEPPTRESAPPTGQTILPVAAIDGLLAT
jgi:hypothetical protein